MARMERDLRRFGCTTVAGVDEVGRGALAGPVTVAAVLLPTGAFIAGLDDSKRLTPSARLRVAKLIHERASGIQVVHMAAHVVDVCGISEAVVAAMRRALARLHPRPDHALVDGVTIGDLRVPSTCIVRGDSTVAVIAAASVVAKVARDEVMVRLDRFYPEWEFARHKGYGTLAHRTAIDRHGLSPVHRRSFAPCKTNGVPRV